MLIIDVRVIDAGTDGETSLVQLLAVFAEQLVVQLRVLLAALMSVNCYRSVDPCLGFRLLFFAPLLFGFSTFTF